jgi:hypothetical protein
MIKRMTALLVATAAAVTITGATAQAAVATDPHQAAHSAAAIRSEDPPAGYSYEGNFYWHASCEAAGQGGIPRAWSAYVCLGDGWAWDSYNLYVKYN